MLFDPRLYALLLIPIFIKKIDYKILLSIYILVLFLMKYLSWESGIPSAIDFSHFDYAMWNSFRKGVAPLSVSIQDTSYYDSLLGNHFAPFLFLPGIFVTLISHHLVTVMLQPVAIVWAIYYLDKILIKFFEFNRKQKGLLLFAFLGIHFFTKVYDFEFHHEIFYIPITLALFYYLYEYKINNKDVFLNKLWIYFLLFLSIKEDSVFIALSFLFPFLFLGNRKKNVLIFSMLLISALYFIVTIKFLMPHFQTHTNQSSFLFLWKKYGDSMVGVVIGALTHPHWVIKDIVFNSTFYKVFYPTLFLPFITVFGILPFSYLAVMLTAVSPYNEMSLYYSAPILSLIFIGFLFGLRKIPVKFRNKIIWLVFLLSLTSGLGTFKVNLPTQNLSASRIEINKILKTYNGNNVILISSGLMAQVDYSIKIRRIENQDTFKRNDIGLIILQKNKDSIPVSSNFINDYISKKRIEYSVVFENDQVIVFKV